MQKGELTAQKGLIIICPAPNDVNVVPFKEVAPVTVNGV
jgi:hypothetical protein